MKTYLTCKDHTVTQETFSLLHDPKTDMLITDPQPQELDRYYESESYISHTDSRQSLMDKIYQAIKYINIQGKLNLMKSYADQEKTLLDVGSGTGDFLMAAKKKGWQVRGVEPNKNAAQKAKEKGAEIVAQLEEITTGNFNTITLWHVLEHLPDLEQKIGQLKNLLSDTGTLIIAVPNYRSYDAEHYKEYWAAYDVPRHLWHFSKKSIEHLFATQGMEIIKTKPMLFDAFYVSLLSEKYKTGKSNPLKATWIGLYSNYKGFWSKEYSSHIYVLQKSKINH